MCWREYVLHVSTFRLARRLGRAVEIVTEKCFEATQKDKQADRQKGDCTACVSITKVAHFYSLPRLCCGRGSISLSLSVCSRFVCCHFQGPLIAYQSFDSYSGDTFLNFLVYADSSSIFLAFPFLLPSPSQPIEPGARSAQPPHHRENQHAQWRRGLIKKRLRNRGAAQRGITMEMKLPKAIGQTESIEREVGRTLSVTR